MRAKNVVALRHKENPFFREPSSVHRWRWMGRVVIGIVVLTLVGVAMFVPRGMYKTGFIIQDGTEETVRAAQSITEQWMASRFFFIPRSHRLFGNLRSLEQALMNSGRFHNVHAARHKGVVTIQYDERITRYVASHADVLYELDREGHVIGRVDDVERMRLATSGTLDRFPILELPNSFAVDALSETATTKRLNTAIEAVEGVRRQTLLTPKRVELTDDPERLNIYTDAGLAIYFALDRDVDAQIYKLEALLNKQLVNISQLTYIDLRYENRLYYH
ncbi:MAG: cell division protein FtsQ/DivIB [Patescibacteria group bacterium]